MAILLPQSLSAGITGACPQDEQKLVLDPDAGNTRSSRSKHDPHADTALHHLPSAFIPFRFPVCVAYRSVRLTIVYCMMWNLRLMSGVFSVTCHHTTGTRSLTEFGTQRFSWTGGPVASGTSVSPPPQSRNTGEYHFILLLGVSALVLMLRHQALSSHGHLPQPFVGLL